MKNSASPRYPHIQQWRQRVALILLLGAGWTVQASAQFGEYFPPPESEGGWRSLVEVDQPVTFAQQRQVQDVAGVDFQSLEQAWKYCRSFDTLDSLLVIRRGWIVGEWRTFENPRATASCTKSLTALAMAKLFDMSEAGLIDVKINEDQFAYQYLPEQWGQEVPGRKHVQLRHLLTMSSGLKPFDGPYRADYLKVVNSRPVESPPGKSWAYSSAEVDLLSLIVERVTGKKLSKFFAQEVAAPLGVPEFDWSEFAKHSTGSGGPMGGAHPPIRDLARIAYMALRQGSWSLEQVISRERVKRYTSWAADLGRATARQPNFWMAKPGGQNYYGYLWWTNRNHESLGPGVPDDAFFMSGWGMKGCFVVPSLDLVVVRLGGDRAMNKHPDFYRELMTRVVAAVVDDDATDPKRVIASADDD